MKSLVICCLLLTSFAALGQSMAQPKPKEKFHMKMTPMLYVDAIEPTLPFWRDRLGFQATVTVPDGDKLGFAILMHGDIELMLQTRHSMGNDMPFMEKYSNPGANLYIEGDDFNDLLKRVDGFEAMAPVRTTFYGMKEIVIKEPGGNIVVFAAKAQ